MNEAELKEMIKANEGCRLNAYADTRGNLTIGYGHLLKFGSTIPQAAADAIFDADFDRACSDYDSLKLELDPGRRAVIIDMIFNMGITNVRKFNMMIKHLHDENWIRAAYELMDSEYAKQVPERAKRNRDRLLRGY
jgi:lysozyme